MQKIKRYLNSFSFPAWSMPLALLVLCFLAFGLFLNQLGFYWDDWAKLLAGRLWGMNSYINYYAEDRPYSAWTHMVLTPILGYAPLPWQIFCFVMRFLAALGAWWTLISLWPAARRQAALIALLFTIYPVFNQQAIAVTFHQQLWQYALFTFSLAFMVQAQRRPRAFVWLTLISLLLSLNQLFITEYFVGVEIVRLPILWILVAEKEPAFKQRIWKTLKLWAPYIILLAAYVVWRLFFIKLSVPDPYQAVLLFKLFKQPLSALGTLARITSVDSFYVLVTSWTQVLDIGLNTYQQFVAPGTLQIWGIGALAALAFILYLARLKDTDEKESPLNNTWLWQALAVGLFCYLGGCAQAWITDRHIIEDFHSNRYALPALLGAAMLWVVAIEWFARSRLQKAVIVGILLGLSIIFHLRTMDDFKNIWNNQLDFYWQLSWRAPGLKPGTALLTEDELFPNQGMFSTGAALNLLYPQSGPKTDADNLDYWIYPMSSRFSTPGVANQPVGLGLHTQFRTLKFEGKTGNSIMVYYDPQRADCLWVLRAEDANNPALRSITRQVLTASNLEQILPETTAGYPPEDMFGKERPRGFCYLYEKAELARQQQDWDTLLSLSEKARQDFGGEMDAFKTPHEWLTFIEGYARAGRWEDARALTYNVREIRMGEFFPYMCKAWQQMTADTPDGPGKAEALQFITNELQCDKY
ncbi:MAG: hypothetical protein LWX83_03205 [Anaerolineae bacterium]|nr:hypothetical protein [Anaerolineae bacterium]